MTPHDCDKTLVPTRKLSAYATAYNALGALQFAKERNTHPSLEALLLILITCPVSTAINERSFSALKYLKTYLRFTRKEAYLNGFALLYVHRDLNTNFEHVIADFFFT